MVINSFDDFFNQRPRKQPKTRMNPNKPAPQIHDMQKIAHMFGKDLLSLLGQWPIKHTPKMNNKVKNEEPNSPEMEKEIIELFWENHNKVRY